MEIPDLPIGTKFKLKSRPDVILQVCKSRLSCNLCFFNIKNKCDLWDMHCLACERKDKTYVLYKQINKGDGDV